MTATLMRMENIVQKEFGKSSLFQLHAWLLPLLLIFLVKRNKREKW